MNLSHPVRRSGAQAIFLAVAMTTLLACGTAASPSPDSGATASPSPDTAAAKPIIRLAFSGQTQVDDIVGYKLVDILRYDYGYNVDARRLDGNISRAAFLAKQVDFVEQSARLAVVFAPEQGGATCFAGNDTRNTYVPVAAGTISGPEELDNPTIGVAQVDGVETYTWEAMQPGIGLPPTYEYIVIGGQSARSAALLAGQIDLGLLSIGNALNTDAEGDVTLLTQYLAHQPAMHNDLYCVRNEWRESTPGGEQAVLDFAKASVEAARWFRDDREAWKTRVLEEVPAFNADVLDQLHELLIEADQFPANGVMTPDGAQDAADVAKLLGDISEAPPLDSWFLSTYEEAALDDLGRR